MAGRASFWRLYWRLFWNAGFLGALLAVAVASIYAVDPTGSPMQTDKLKHFFAYGVLGGLGWMALRPATRGLAVFLAVALAAYGVGLEGAQYFTENRHPDIMDAAANALGAASGVFLVGRARAGRG